MECMSCMPPLLSRDFSCSPSALSCVLEVYGRVSVVQGDAPENSRVSVAIASHATMAKEMSEVSKVACHASHGRNDRHAFSGLSDGERRCGDFQAQWIQYRK